MTDLNTELPAALRRALELLSDPPATPDVSQGYLDLLGTEPAEDAGPAKNTGPLQAMFATPIGSMLYDKEHLLVPEAMLKRRLEFLRGEYDREHAAPPERKR